LTETWSAPVVFKIMAVQNQTSVWTTTVVQVEWHY